MHQKMINKKIKKAIDVFLLLFGILMGYYIFFLEKDEDDIKVCNLYNIAVKGKISKLVQSKLLYFEIDNLDGTYYAPFYIFGKSSCENCKSDESYFEQVGDSIIKEANSKFIIFKREKKIFTEELDTKNCNDKYD